MHPRRLIAVVIASTLTLTCSLVGGIADVTDSPAPSAAPELETAEPTRPITPTVPAALDTLYAPYTSGGQQAWRLGPGEPVLVDLPVPIGSFYGYALATDRILFAQTFSTHGAGPGPISVSDLAILDLGTGEVQVLFLTTWSRRCGPQRPHLAYILATLDLRAPLARLNRRRPHPRSRRHLQLGHLAGRRRHRLHA
jgi:hypothetical protein